MELHQWYHNHCKDKAGFRSDLIQAAPIKKQTFYKLLSKGVGANSKLHSIINALKVKYAK